MGKGGKGGKEATYFRLESPVLPVELETELSWSANEEGAPVVSDFPSGLESGKRRNIELGRGGGRGGGEEEEEGEGEGKRRRKSREKRSGTSDQMSSTSV